jgi:hypothetical protein
MTFWSYCGALADRDRFRVLFVVAYLIPVQAKLPGITMRRVLFLATTLTAGPFNRAAVALIPR